MLKGTTLDASQESKLQAAQDLKKTMQELYFNQLKILISKDWNSYQAIFSDKLKFEQFFEVINKFRIDAHPRELNDEDEALLNIAFKFFENALGDI